MCFMKMSHHHHHHHHHLTFNSQYLISNSPYDLSYSSCDISMENLVLDQPIIHNWYFFLYSHHLSAWHCINIIRRILSWSLMGVKGLGLVGLMENRVNRKKWLSFPANHCFFPCFSLITNSWNCLEDSVQTFVT